MELRTFNWISMTTWKDRYFIINFKTSHQMKKSKLWLIVAIISIIFAAHYALNCLVFQAMIGITTCCASLVIGAWYEREEKEQEENH